MSFSSIEMRRSGATCCLMRLPPASPSGSGSASCVIIWAMVSMTSLIGRCLGRQGVLLLQPALLCVPPPPGPSPAHAPARWPPIQVQAAFRLLCPPSVRPAASPTASTEVSRTWAARPTALRRAWPSRFKVSSTRLAPNSGVESSTARSCRAPNPPVCSANATVRANRVLSKVVGDEPHPGS